MNGDNEQWPSRLDKHADAPPADASDPELTSYSRYRMAVYRFARTRLREALNVGTPSAIAVWTAGRAAGEFYDLEPSAWAHLIHALLVSVSDQG